MSLEQLKDLLPEYAKDIRLNISAINSVTSLNPQQLWGTALSAALATKYSPLIQAVMADAAGKLSPEALNAAKTANSIMAMNNIYYRFVHLMGEGHEYKKMPAKLRMNAIANPGVDRLDFELWSLAVSAINGCGMCLESHEHEVMQKGATREMVQDAVRIAAILHAVASTLQGEEATGQVFQGAAAAE